MPMIAETEMPLGVHCAEHIGNKVNSLRHRLVLPKHGAPDSVVSAAVTQMPFVLVQGKGVRLLITLAILLSHYVF